MSLTSVIGKVMEKCIKCYMQQLIDQNDFQANEQHGFVAKRSCATNLPSAQESWIKAVDKDHDVDVIFIDFSEAFDRVNHYTNQPATTV